MLFGGPNEAAFGVEGEDGDEELNEFEGVGWEAVAGDALGVVTLSWRGMISLANMATLLQFGKVKSASTYSRR